MKKAMMLMLAMVLCVSLAACGNAYAKYDKLIAYLEQSDYESAHAEIDRLEAFDESNDKTAGVLTVEVTAENWQQYFKMEERFVTTKNNFDEISDVYKSVYLVLKDEYTMVNDGDNQTSVAVEYNFIKEWHYVTKNLTAGTLTIGKLVPDKTTTDMSGSMVTITSKETSLTNGREWSEGMQAIPMDFEIVRIKGTLYIKG